MARGGRWIADASVACPVLVPLTSLGRRVVATEGDGARADSFAIAAAPAARAAGGTQLRATCLSEELFAAAAMEAVQKDLMAMKVTELKEELEARGEARGQVGQQVVAAPAAARGDRARVFRGSGRVRVGGGVKFFRACGARTFSVLLGSCTAVHF